MGTDRQLRHVHAIRESDGMTRPTDMVELYGLADWFSPPQNAPRVRAVLSPVEAVLLAEELLHAARIILDEQSVQRARRRLMGTSDAGR